MSGLRRFLFYLPLFFPLGEWFTPPPTPSPWTWREGAARRWSAQDGLRWLQEGLKEPKMASKIVQDSPRWFKIAINMHPRALETASGRLQVPFELSKEAPKRPKSFKSLVFFYVFCILAVSRPMGS